MEPGALRHKIQIQAPVQSDDPFAPTPDGGWSTVATTYAKIETAQQAAKYMPGLGTDGMQVTHVITIRFPGNRYTVAAGYRISFTYQGVTSYYSVNKGIINPDMMNRMLMLLVFEIDPAQGGVQG